MLKNGNKIYKLAKELWPYNRSITGINTFKSLKIIKKKIKKLKIIKVKTNTKVYDWKIPPEWSVKEAYIENIKGQKIVDYKKCNLHLISHSSSLKKQNISLKFLKKKLFFNKKNSNSIPYRTTYYKKDWGFCISYKQYKSLKEPKYKVNIETNFKKGNLYYGELFVKGKSNKEILFSTNICHPSLANNELSGPTVLTFLSNFLLKRKNYFSYRIVFVPETIGSLTLIKKRLIKKMKSIIFGFNCVCLGDEKNYSILFSKYNNSLSDYFGLKAIKKTSKKFKRYSWLERGSDERQYSSPGVEVPITSLMRSKYGVYKEYHTSNDKLGSVVTRKGLYGGYKLLINLINIIENEKYPKSRFIGEPHLSKRNLYPSLGGDIHPKIYRDILNFLSYCDGNNPIGRINELCKIKNTNGFKIFKTLLKKKIILLK